MARRRRRTSLAFGVLFLLCLVTRPTHSQATNPNPVTGARRYAQFCAACHGADGKGGDKGAPLVTGQSVANRSDADLYRIVHDGTPQGMPPFAQIGDANIGAVVHYLRFLEESSIPAGASTKPPPPGDAGAGRALFFGKAQCSLCHMVEGHGGFIASNLTTYARNRSVQAILQDIASPDSPLVRSSRVVTVTTDSGQQLTGILRNEDAFNLELQTQDGRYYFFSRNNLSQVTYSDHSLMPRDYTTRLTPNQLSDVVSFLISSSQTPPPATEPAP